MLGFELLYSTIKSNLKSKNDLLVAVIHLQCINNGFVCVGTGEEVCFDFLICHSLKHI